MQNIPEKITRQWLAKLGMAVSAPLLRKQIQGHPHYPSLISITDSMDYLGIENAVVQVGKEQLHEVPTPFLAHLKSNGGQFVIVENRDTVENVYPGFFKAWTGVAVMAEKPAAWSHHENEEELRRDRKVMMASNAGVASVILVALTAIVFTREWVPASSILVALAGVFISWLITSKTLGIDNKMADQLCGRENDCDKVIHSKAAKLPIGITWGDVGLIWFASMLCVLIASSFAGNITGVLRVLLLQAIASIPFTFFSIFYQWRIVKKWCRLCLLAVTLLWMQAAILLPGFNEFSHLINETGAIIFTSSTLLLVAAGWFSFKSLLQQNRKQEDASMKAIRFKRNETVFYAMLEKQRKVHISPWENELQLGNANAALQIMVACNPYCGPCASAHKKLHDMLARYGMRIGLAVRFTIKANDKKDKRTEAIEHILKHVAVMTANMDATEKAKYTANVLHEWFVLMNYDAFIQKYPSLGEINVDDTLKRHQAWMDKSNIAFTPTLFINGRELPSLYSIDDLAGIMTALIEEYSETETKASAPLLA